MHFRCATAAVILAGLAVGTSLGQSPLGTGFTYQGRLQQNGQPFTGSANLVFKLFDAPTGGNLLGTQTLNGVTVSAGLFTVLLDPNSEFGANAFNGQRRWLEVTANGTLLAPRQALTATPYAEFASAPWITSGANLSYTAGSVGGEHDDAAQPPARGRRRTWRRHPVDRRHRNRSGFPVL